MINITGSNVTLLVKDMDKTIDFYESIGLTLQNRWDNHYAMVIGPGITLGIHPAGDKTDLNSGSISIGFMIEKIEDSKAILDRNSISYKTDDGKSGIYLHFKDPDDTLLYFVQPKWQ